MDSQDKYIIIEDKDLTFDYTCSYDKTQLEYQSTNYGPRPMYYERDKYKCSKCKKIYEIR